MKTKKYFLNFQKSRKMFLRARFTHQEDASQNFTKKNHDPRTEKTFQKFIKTDAF